MEAVGTAICVLHVILPTELTLGRQLDPAVVEETVLVDFVVVHEPGEVGAPERLLVEEVVPEVAGGGPAAEHYGHCVGQRIAEVSVRLICTRNEE